MNKVTIHSIAAFVYVLALPGVCAWDGGREEAVFYVDPGQSFSEKTMSLREQEAAFCKENSVWKITERWAIEDGNRHLLGEKIKYKKY
ncbi:MAG: hypothetical protein WC514_02935 [Candidatus Paceibacterota bacterium]